MTVGPPLDPIALLMPDASPADVDLASRVARALCILSCDAVDSGSPSVNVQLDTARDELDLYHADAVGSLLQDLLTHVAVRSLPATTSLILPVVRRSYAEAWGRAFAAMTDEERARLGLTIPDPGTPALESLAGLVSALEKHGKGQGMAGGGVKPLVAQLWRVRLGSLAGTLDAATTQDALESILRELAQLRGAQVRALRLAVLGDLAASQLDDGRVAAAHETVRRAGLTASRPADVTGTLDLLGLMAQWWLGEGPPPALEDAFRRCSAMGLAPAHWSEAMACVEGASVDRAPSLPFKSGGGPGGKKLAEAGRGALEMTAQMASKRRTLGASALLVSVLRPDGQLIVRSVDVAPGLGDYVKAWTDRHRLALADRETIEHDVGCRAAPLMLISGQGRGEHQGRIEAYCLAGRGGALARGRDGKAAASFAAPRALVVEPLLDADGEPWGLLWLEYATRWVPARELRAAAARALCAEHFSASHGAPGVPESRRGALVGARPAIELEAPNEGHRADRVRDADEDMRRAWELAVDSLQLKTAERRWIAFHIESGTALGGDESPGPAGPRGACEPCEQVGDPSPQLRAVAEGGGAAARLGAPRHEGTWAIRRALRTGGAIRYGLGDGHVNGASTGIGGEADPTMLHCGATSGAALPLHRDGRVIAVLSLESVRRGDAREGDVARWFELLQEAGPALEVMAWSSLDRRRFDGGFTVSAEDPEFHHGHGRLRALGSSNCDVLVVGEIGSGRRTWTRMIHYAGAPAHGHGSACTEMMVRSAFGLEAAAIRRIAGDGSVGALAISDVEWLSPEAQAALTEVCTEPLGQRPRILASMGQGNQGVDSVVGHSLEQSGSSASGSNGGTLGGAPALQSNGIHPQLLRQLGRVVVRCRPLRERRHEIPALVEFLLRRIAARDGHAAQVLDDRAHALLWRQPWAENITGLEAVLYALALRSERPGSVFAAGRMLESHGSSRGASQPIAGPSAVQAALLDCGLEVAARVPSRMPKASDVHSALWVTRTATRRLNKTRAALYLGWDPNTLAARLKDEGLQSLAEVAAAMEARADERLE